MMASGPDRYRNRLLTVVAVTLTVGALRIGYAVAMPVAVAALIIAAVWPLKCWFDRWLPSWLSYGLAILALLSVLIGFFAAVYFSLGQMIAVLSGQWAVLQESYGRLVDWAAGWGVRLNRTADGRRAVAVLETLASSVYQFATYTGFIAILVILGLPEVPRLRDELQARARGELVEAITAISSQVRGYLGTTMATSLLTGVASAAWALITGLDLPLVWGLLNFLLNFVPVIGNIIGIIPPTLYALVQYHGWGMPLLVFAGFAALQIAISNFVYPILQGRRLSLSPLAIVVAMTFWSWVWGIPGALIAVPLTAAMVIVCSHFERSQWVAKLLSA